MPVIAIETNVVFCPARQKWRWGMGNQTGSPSCPGRTSQPLPGSPALRMILVLIVYLECLRMRHTSMYASNSSSSTTYSNTINNSSPFLLQVEYAVRSAGLRMGYEIQNDSYTYDTPNY